MAYRISIAFTVSFWLVMTGLLVRLQTSDSRILSVPPVHVVRLLLAQTQSSELGIYNGGFKLGSVTITPRSFAGDGSGVHEITLSGGMSIRLGEGERKRIHFNGSMELDKSYEVTVGELKVDSKDPAVDLNIRFDRGKNEVRYELVSGGGRMAGTFGGSGPGMAQNQQLAMFGIDAAQIQSFANQLGQPALEAKRTELRLRGEKIECYLLTIRLGTFLDSQIYMSQFGQILMVKTPMGYDLYADDLQP